MKGEQINEVTLLLSTMKSQNHCQRLSVHSSALTVHFKSRIHALSTPIEITEFQISVVFSHISHLPLLA